MDRLASSGYLVTLKVNSDAYDHESAARVMNEKNLLIAKQSEDQKQQLTLEVDLKSGKKKPNNFKEAMMAYGAIDGNYLAGAPKIRADNALYGIIGKISIANKDDSLVAAFDNYGQKQFEVKIPPELKEEYLSTAQIGSYFIAVGRYNDNKEYNTASGSTLVIIQTPLTKGSLGTENPARL